MDPVTLTVGAKLAAGAKHALARTLSVICTLLVIAGIGYAIYVAFIKPNTKGRLTTNTTNQSAKQIVNYHVVTEEDHCWVDTILFKTLCFKQKQTLPVVTEVENGDDSNSIR